MNTKLRLAGLLAVTTALFGEAAFAEEIFFPVLSSSVSSILRSFVFGESAISFKIPFRLIYLGCLNHIQTINYHS